MAEVTSSRSADARRRAVIDAVLDDQRSRWEKGERPPAEHYLQKHTWLLQDREALLDLLDQEIVLRAECGEHPALADFVRRFPELQDSLQVQFELHHHVVNLPSPESIAAIAQTQPGSAVLDTRIAPAGNPFATEADWDFVQSSTAELFVENQKFGPYRVVRALGRGAMGSVYLAEDPALKRHVALKVLLPAIAADKAARQRFLREAQSAAALDHDNIITVYQVGEDAGIPYLAMQLLQGETVDDRLSRERRLPWTEVLRIARETAQGLSAAHRCGLLHRDIKPANLWLDRERGRVKILDFGLAQVANADQQLTALGALVGTPAYMSPEQATGRGIDARSDLFSLGAVLYQAATGKIPFQGPTVMATLSALANEDPPEPRLLNQELPLEMSACIARLLRKNPAERFASADDLITHLNDIEAKLRAAAPARTNAKPPEMVESPTNLPVPASGRGTGKNARRTPRRSARSEGDGKGSLRRTAVNAGGWAVLVVLAVIVIKITFKNGTEAEITLPEVAKVTVSSKPDDSVPAPDKGPVKVPPAVFADSIGWERLKLDEVFRSEGVAAADVNHDGKMDVLAGEVWYEAPDWEMHEIRTPLVYDAATGYSNSFANWAYDVNDDGWADLICVGFSGREAFWFENPRNQEGHWSQHLIWPSSCNQSPQFADVTGDGRPELIMASQPEGQVGYFELPTPDKATQKWQFVPVSTERSIGSEVFYHGLGIGDINSDNRPDIVIPHGWWEQPERLGAGPWTFHPLTLNTDGNGNSFPAADIHLDDLDLDGDNDLMMCSPHDSGIWWFENVGPAAEPKFAHHLIDDRFSQTHALQLADINGDGTKDLITGKRFYAHGPNRDPDPQGEVVMYWYEIQRQKGADPRVVPHKIDAGTDTGIGTQFLVTDMNGDQRLDIVLSNKKGTNVLIQRVNPVAPAAGSRTAALSRMALVGNPSELLGVKSWSIETRWRRGWSHCTNLNAATGLLAIGSDDGTVRLWDARTGQLRGALVGHNGRVVDVQLSADGSYLASAANDGTVRVWNPATGKLLRTIVAERPQKVWLSPVEPRLAIASGDVIDIWNLAASEKMHSVHQAKQQIVAGDWSPDGKTFAAGTATGNIVLWDVVTGTLQKVLDCGAVLVRDLAFAPDGDRLAECHGDASSSKITIWDSSTGVRTRTMDKLPGGVGCLAWMPIGGRLAAYFGTGTVQIVAVDEGVPSQTLDCAPHLTASLAFLPDGGSCIVAGHHREIWAWQPDSGKLLYHLPAFRDFPEVFSVAASPDKGTLAVCASDGTVRIWEDRPGSEPQTIRQDDFRGVTRAAWSPDGKKLAIAGTTPALFIWDHAGQKLSSRAAATEPMWANCVAWSPDGRFVTSGGTTAQRLFAWDVETGRREWEFSGPVLFWAAWAPGKNLAVTDFQDRVLTQRDAATGKVLFRLPIENRCHSIAWSPDGTTAACAVSYELLLWSNEGKVVRKLAPTGNLRSVAWSPDGQRLAGYSLSDNWEIEVWDAASARELRRWRSGCVNHHELTSLVWSPDGRFIVNASDTGIACIWNPETAARETTLVTWHEGTALISRDGHYLKSGDVEGELIYVVETEAGQSTLTPTEFSAQYGWKNDPGKVRLYPTAE